MLYEMHRLVHQQGTTPVPRGGEWITLEDKKSAFSFDNVCEMLEFDPEYMRRGLRNWKIQKLEAIEQVHIARRADLRTD